VAVAVVVWQCHIQIKQVIAVILIGGKLIIGGSGSGSGAFCQ
jgi:hypothetical protein